MQTIGSYTDLPQSFYSQFTPYFTRVSAPAGTFLWRQGDTADGLYLIESGSLRATYEYNADDRVLETMVAGTVAGDLSTLSDTHRNATVVAERDSVLWKLAPASLAKMEKEKPEAAATFVKIVLKGELRRDGGRRLANIQPLSRKLMSLLRILLLCYRKMLSNVRGKGQCMLHIVGSRPDGVYWCCGEHGAICPSVVAAI